jgi:hypothetical protein
MDDPTNAERPDDAGAEPGTAEEAAPIHVMTLSGRIVLRKRAGADLATPTVTKIERELEAALELAGYAASVELVRTDR